MRLRSSSQSIPTPVLLSWFENLTPGFCFRLCAPQGHRVYTVVLATLEPRTPQANERHILSAHSFQQHTHDPGFLGGTSAPCTHSALLHLLRIDAASPRGYEAAVCRSLCPDFFVRSRNPTAPLLCTVMPLTTLTSFPSLWVFVTGYLLPYWSSLLKPVRGLGGFFFCLVHACWYYHPTAFNANFSSPSPRPEHTLPHSYATVLPDAHTHRHSSITLPL